MGFIINSHEKLLHVDVAIEPGVKNSHRLMCYGQYDMGLQETQPIVERHETPTQEWIGEVKKTVVEVVSHICEGCVYRMDKCPSLIGAHFGVEYLQEGVRGRVFVEGYRHVDNQRHSDFCLSGIPSDAPCQSNNS